MIYNINFSIFNIYPKLAYSKTCLKRPLKKDQFSLNTGQKYCRMLHSAILSTYIKLPFVIKIFVFFFFEWLLKTGFTVYLSLYPQEFT